MASLQGPVICPVVRAKQTGVYAVPRYTPVVKANKLVGSGFLGLKVINRVDVANQTLRCTNKMIRCTFSSSSNGNGSMAGNFSENDSDYVNSSVVEAGTLLQIFFISHKHFFSFLGLWQWGARIHIQLCNWRLSLLMGKGWLGMTCIRLPSPTPHTPPPKKEKKLKYGELIEEEFANFLP